MSVSGNKKRGLFIFYFVVFMAITFSVQAVWADSPQDLVKRAEGYIKTIEEAEAQIKKGHNVPVYEQKRLEAAESFNNILAESSELYVNQKVMNSWFSTGISKFPFFTDIVIEFVSITILSMGDVANASNMRFKNMGVFSAIEKMVGGDPILVDSWLNHRWEEYRSQLIRDLSSQDPQERGRVLRHLRPLLRDAHLAGHFINQVMNFVSESSRLQILPEIIEIPEAPVRQFLMKNFFININWKKWAFERWGEFSILLLDVAQRPRGASLIVNLFSEAPEIAKSQRSLTVTEVSDKTVFEQLLLSSEVFKNELFLEPLEKLVAIKPLGEIIQTIFDLGLKPPQDMARVLSYQSELRADPRWVGWVSQLTPSQRMPYFNNFMQTEAVVFGATEEAIDLQKRMFRDLIEVSTLYNETLADGRVVKSLSSAYDERVLEFLKIVPTNRALIGEFSLSWGEWILLHAGTEVASSFLEKVFSHSDVDNETRLQWLELILLNKPNRHATLLPLLVAYYGMDPSFEAEIKEIGISSEERLSIMREAMTEVFLAGTIRGQRVRCHEIFL